MSNHDRFLAMVLTNAKRVEARALVLTVTVTDTRIDMLLLDGSSQSITPPPPEVVVALIEQLEEGQTSFSSSVFAVTIENVEVKRGPESVIAHISDWNIEHN